LPDEFLDAFAELKSGEISRVVETDMGFHILTWQTPPSEEQVTAVEIVVSYTGADMNTVPVGRSVARSRAAAEVLAANLARTARASSPDKFADLIAQYSDHVDAARGGDIGSYSTHRAGAMSREVEHIDRLAFGAISEPLDTSLGFRIFKREAPRAREPLAVRHLIIPYLTAANRSEARDEAHATARKLHSDVDRGHADISDLQSSYCCKGVQQWIIGNEHPTLEAEVLALKFGQISRLFEYNSEFHVVQRIEPTLLVEANDELSFELPSDKELDVAYFLRQGENPQALAAYIGSLKSLALQFAAQSKPDAQKHIRAAFEELEQSVLSQNPADRVRELVRMRTRLAEQLGVKSFALLRDKLQRQIILDVAPDLRSRIDRE
jgi:hypothetical protein